MQKKAINSMLFSKAKRSMVTLPKAAFHSSKTANVEVRVTLKTEKRFCR